MQEEENEMNTKEQDEVERLGLADAADYRIDRGFRIIRTVK